MCSPEKSRLYASLPMLSETGARAGIDADALRRNVRRLTSRLPEGTRRICVVKADAYGHGVRFVAPALWQEGCHAFAVSCIEEAAELRGILPEAEILILGYVPPEQAKCLAAQRLTATALSGEYTRAISREAARQGVTVSLHIKLDTGMSRIGFPACSPRDREETVKEIPALSGLPGLLFTGIYSHFACADEPDGEALTKTQAERYLAVTTALEKAGFDPGTRHLCNSAGALRYPEYAFDAVRLGIALYGYLPMAVPGLETEPVMRLYSNVTHLHTLSAGESVGYGATFRAADERRIATLAIGYADGFLRAYGGATVTFHTASGDFRAPLVGRVCMDQCMADVTGLPVAVGDAVTLFGGERQELETLAARAGTIPYESLCLVSARVPRVAVTKAGTP